jgi:hypothetical protein
VLLNVSIEGVCLLHQCDVRPLKVFDDGGCIALQIIERAHETGDRIEAAFTVIAQ